jgi:hypothetical protein
MPDHEHQRENADRYENRESSTHTSPFYGNRGLTKNKPDTRETKGTGMGNLRCISDHAWVVLRPSYRRRTPVLLAPGPLASDPQRTRRFKFGMEHRRTSITMRVQAAKR